MIIVKSFSVGDGDMFYIRHGNDTFTIIDCCLSEENYNEIVDELKEQSKDKNVTRFISTHPDDDHISGLSHLNKEMPIRNFYCVKNAVTKSYQTEDFKEYCVLRDDTNKAFYIHEGCKRKWMNEEDKERGSSGISILWPVGTNKHFIQALQQANRGESPNNISPIVKYSVKSGVTVLWMGDLTTDFMEKIKNDISIGPIDILFAPHHGRDTVPSKWLNEMKPRIIIIGEAPSENLNYYNGYDTITQNSAGDITIECDAGEANIYVSDWEYSVDFLFGRARKNTYGKYIGTLELL